MWRRRIVGGAHISHRCDISSLLRRVSRTFKIQCSKYIRISTRLLQVYNIAIDNRISEAHKYSSVLERVGTDPITIIIHIKKQVFTSRNYKDSRAFDSSDRCKPIANIDYYCAKTHHCTSKKNPVFTLEEKQRRQILRWCTPLRTDRGSINIHF